MNGYDKYFAAIQLFFDNEMCGHSLDEFRVHLKYCATCRHRLEEEEELSRTLKETRPLFTASSALRQNVLLLLRT
jgi:hypothetical protein